MRPPGAGLQPHEDIMPGISMPEHPLKRDYERRIMGQAAIFVTTLVCMSIAVIIFFLASAGKISPDARSLGLMVLLVIWIVITGLISKTIYGRFTIGFGGNSINTPPDEDEK